MQKKENKNTIFEMCPIRNVIARFGNKWAFLILLTINDSDKIRFSHLQEQIPDISKNILSKTLKTLLADGLIEKKTFNEMPFKTEYALTNRGNTLIPIIEELTAWANKNLPNILKHRKEFDKTDKLQ